MSDEKDIAALANKLQNQMLAFGQSRTPLDQNIDTERLVVAGSQILFRIPKDWSFHQFLISYGGATLGPDWIRANLKAGSQIHPIVANLFLGLADVRATGRIVDAFDEFTMNGELYAFISFAYDLFTIADNAGVQQSLLSRVRIAEQFQGARFEIFVAASLLRAGFTIAFEDESDARTSHCEFTATHRETRRSFSVEAKSRTRQPQNLSGETAIPARMYRILRDALSKKADHERIVFADVNLPSDKRPVFQEAWHREVTTTLNELERDQKPNDPWPQAIMFFTNRKTSPWPEDAGRVSSTVLLTAINHPLFKIEDRIPLERAYPEIGALFHATNERSAPPRHFFGQ